MLRTGLPFKSREHTRHHEARKVIYFTGLESGEGRSVSLGIDYGGEVMRRSRSAYQGSERCVDGDSGMAHSQRNQLKPSVSRHSSICPSRQKNIRRHAGFSTPFSFTSLSGRYPNDKCPGSNRT